MVLHRPVELARLLGTWPYPSWSIICTNEVSCLKGSLYEHSCILFERMYCGHFLVAPRTSKSSSEILIGLLSGGVLSISLRVLENLVLEIFPNDPPEPHRFRSDP